jgi:hypothetical protein
LLTDFCGANTKQQRLPVARHDEPFQLRIRARRARPAAQPGSFSFNESVVDPQAFVAEDSVHVHTRESVGLPTRAVELNDAMRKAVPCSIALAGLLAFSVRATEPAGGAPAITSTRSASERPQTLPASIRLAARTAAIKKFDALPYVQSEYAKLFRFDTFANPKLKELRERYKLDAVVAPGRDEFEQQSLLLDWVHHRFKKFGRPSVETTSALEILKGIEEGQPFFCVQYAHLYASAAASLGWVDRELALRRHQDPPGGGSTEHLTTEIWSNQHHKWVMMDPTANMRLEKNGIPLSGFELRQEWFYHEGSNLVFVMGKERRQYRKADLPIFLGRFAGFGDLTVPADELCKYGFIGYIPNTDLMDAGPDYGKMFIVKDNLCDGTRWHTRVNPANPAVDPYFPINQAAVSLAPEQDKVRVTLRTMTPNFKRYEARIDGGRWTSTEASFLWSLHPGSNRLELRTVNQFGVNGPVSTVEIEV